VSVSKSLNQQNETQTKRVQTRYGEMVVFPANDLISESLIQYGEWAHQEIEVFAKFIKEGDAVLDVGGYIGTHARAFSILVGQQGSVCTFEPSQITFSLLERNIEYGKFNNIKAFNCALGDIEAINILIIDDVNNHGASAVKINSAIEGKSTSKVAIKTLDRLDGIRKVDFFKIDVEGMELNVLNGAKVLVKNSRPVIFAEVNSLDNSAGLLSWAEENRYKVFGLLCDAYNDQNFKNNSNNVFGIAKEAGFLLVPDEKIGEYRPVLDMLRLPVIENNDDIVLLLLHKPQYPHEVLAKTASAKVLGLDYQSQLCRSDEQKFVNLEKALNDANLELSELRQILQLTVDSVRIKDKQILDNAHFMSLLRGSLSWKLTKPLRALRVLQKYGVSGLRQVLRNRNFNDIQWQIRKTRHLFDKDYYLRRYPDVLESDVDPIEHYLKHGWKEQRKPSARFDGQYYLTIHEDVAASNVCPLLHYAVYGEKEKRLQNDHHQWRLINRQPIVVNVEHITVILPVYRDVEMTASCIDAALPAILGLDAKLVIINDKSPDSGMLDMLEKRCKAFPNAIKLINNEQNLGFVKSVNRGLDLSQGCDVVLLNSDVIVGESWLERLRDEAYSFERIATVTPLSNNTTISAFPNFLEENGLPFGLDVNCINNLFNQTSLPNVTAPTGIGFCMYIRGDCIDEIGKFDEETFGRGYGEENDFCQRALKKGWLNILTPNIYVYHKGGVSFGADKQTLVDTALLKINCLHRNYHADVRNFIEADLLKSSRVIRLIELMKGSALPVIMHISHGLGGGVLQHIRELAEFVSKDAISIMLVPFPNSAMVKLKLGWQESDNEILFDLNADEEILTTVLRALPLSFIHYHHVMNLPDKLLTVARDLDIPYQFTVHDFYLLNGNPTLTNEDFIYPGRYTDDLRNPVYPLPDGMTAADWRAKYQDFWNNARKVIFPSDSTKEMFEGHYSLHNAIKVWHPEGRRGQRYVNHNFERKEKYRIGILGALSREKGADYLEEIATLARDKNLPYDFLLIGFAYRELSNVTTTGQYQEAQLNDLISDYGVDIIFFPARCPETYSYTLSYAIDSGRPIIAPDIGAFPERLSDYFYSHCINFLSSPESVLESFGLCVSRWSRVEGRAACRVNAGEQEAFYGSEYLFVKREGISLDLNDTWRELLVEILKKHSLETVRGSGISSEKLLKFCSRIYYHNNMRWFRRLLSYKNALKIKNILFK